MKRPQVSPEDTQRSEELKRRAIDVINEAYGGGLDERLIFIALTELLFTLGFKCYGEDIYDLWQQVPKRLQRVDQDAGHA